MFRNQTILANAVRAVARVESQAGNTAGNASVDLSAIQTFIAATNGLKNMTLNRLVIYDAITTGVQVGTAPSLCRTGVFSNNEVPHGRPTSSPNPPVAGTNCSVYMPQQVTDVQNGKLISNTAVSTVFGCKGSTKNLGPVLLRCQPQQHRRRHDRLRGGLGHLHLQGRDQPGGLVDDDQRLRRLRGATECLTTDR